MTIEDDIVFIERVPTLRTLGRDALRILAIGAESRYVHKGEVLFVAGETGRQRLRHPGRLVPAGDHFQARSATSSSGQARCSASWR